LPVLDLPVVDDPVQTREVVPTQTACLDWSRGGEGADRWQRFGFDLTHAPKGSTAHCIFGPTDLNPMAFFGLGFKMSSVTLQFLLERAEYALEQCALLLGILIDRLLDGLA